MNCPHCSQPIQNLSVETTTVRGQTTQKHLWVAQPCGHCLGVVLPDYSPEIAGLSQGCHQMFAVVSELVKKVNAVLEDKKKPLCG